MSSWPGAVLCDFDGVIVNSEPLHFFAFHKVLADENIDLTQSQYYSDLIGFDDRGAFRHLYAKHQLPLEPKTLLRLMTRKSEVVMEMIEQRNYQALPGVEEFVRELWRQYPLGICSGARREEIEAMLEGVSLRDCFPIIVAAKDVTVGKPDPQGYLLCAQLISQKIKTILKPADCLVVEDAPTVIRSVKSAGFPTLAVASSHAPDRLAEADWVVATLAPAEVREKCPGSGLESDMMRKLQATALCAAGSALAASIASAQSNLPAEQPVVQPVIPANSAWVGVMLIIIAGLFLAAACIGPIVRANLHGERGGKSQG